MTTGRINQITNLSGLPGAWQEPPGRPARPTPPRTGARVEILGRGATSAPGRREPPGVPGSPRATIQLPPLSPSRPVRHAEDPARPPGRAGAGCGIWPSGGGTGPRGHAGERRLPQGGSLQESRRQVWPAANHPQTPTEPGTQGPPGFGRRYDASLARHGRSPTVPHLAFSPGGAPGVRGPTATFPSTE